MYHERTAKLSVRMYELSYPDEEKFWRAELLIDGVPLAGGIAFACGHGAGVLATVHALGLIPLEEVPGVE